MAAKKPSRYCKYFGCKNNSATEKIHMFRFPKDKIRCRLWIKACKNPKLVGIPESKHYNNSYLCNQHFQEWCFMNTKLRNKLVHNAVPDYSNAIAIEELECGNDNSAVKAHPPASKLNDQDVEQEIDYALDFVIKREIIEVDTEYDVNHEIKQRSESDTCGGIKTEPDECESHNQDYQQKGSAIDYALDFIIKQEITEVDHEMKQTSNNCEPRGGIKTEPLAIERHHQDCEQKSTAMDYDISFVIKREITEVDTDYDVNQMMTSKNSSEAETYDGEISWKQENNP